LKKQVTKSQTKLVVKDSTQLQLSVDELIRLMKSAMGQNVTEQIVVAEEDVVVTYEVQDPPRYSVTKEDIEVTKVKELIQEEVVISKY